MLTSGATGTGGGGGGGASTIADGSDVVEGALADAAVVTDTSGTLSGKLRGLVKWAFERMPASLGQKAMAASFPVVIASDQSALSTSSPITLASATLTNNADTLVIDTTDKNVVSIRQTATTGGWDGSAYFQGSNDGGTTWANVDTTNTSDNFALTGFVSGAVGGIFRVNVAGYNKFRLSIANRTTGTSTWALQAASAAIDPYQSVQLINGSVRADIDGGGRLQIVLRDTGGNAILGQQLAAASLPVVLTAAQQTALTPPAAITGFALEAGHLAAIDTSTAKIPAQGQALAAASMPVVLTAAQVTTLTPPAAIVGFALEATLGSVKTAVELIDNAVSGAGFNVTQQGGVAVSLNTGVRDAGTQRVTIATNDVVPISAASLPLPTGAALDATIITTNSEIGIVTETAPATDTASSGLNGRLQRIAQRLTSLIALLPTALVGGRLDTNTGAWLGSTAPTVGSKTSANSVPVVIASDQGLVAVKEAKAATPAQSSVSVLTTNTVILAANANRLGATLYNESGAIAYVKLGVTSSLTSYSVQIAIGGYYEVPFGYTGGIDGITVAITAVLRVTELTA